MNEVERRQEAVSVCVLVLRERERVLRSIVTGKVYIKCDHEGEAKRRKGGERKVSRRDAELCGRCWGILESLFGFSAVFVCDCEHSSV